MNRVVVTGLGTISAAGNDVNSSWERVLSGTSGIDTISLFDASELPVQIAGQIKNFDPKTVMDTKSIRRSSRFIQIALQAATEAIADSGFLEVTAKEKVGCIIGVGMGALDVIEEMQTRALEKGSERISPFFVPSVIANMAAGYVANYFELKGTNLCISTACTSGTHAIGEAYENIRRNQSEVVVSGGSESTICALGIAGFHNMKALSQNNSCPGEASRPFDEQRDGFVMGEGSGILILENLDHAMRRGAKIYAEIIGYGTSADAYHITTPAPKGEGFRRCMESALNDAGIEREKISYINAHGTSTYYNDIRETEAILGTFGDHAKQLMISSTKGVTGHCLGAAGGIEAVFLTQAIANSIVPPTANLRDPDPLCPLDYVPLTPREATIKYGMSNSFGFGGTNASIIMTSANSL